MLNAYSADSITIVRDMPRDKWGVPGTPTTEKILGVVTWKTRLVRNFAGEEVVSRGFIEATYDGTIDHKDKIRINSVDYPILALEPLKTFNTKYGLRISIA